VKTQSPRGKEEGNREAKRGKRDKNEEDKEETLKR